MLDPFGFEDFQCGIEPCGIIQLLVFHAGDQLIKRNPLGMKGICDVRVERFNASGFHIAFKRLPKRFNGDSGNPSGCIKLIITYRAVTYVDRQNTIGQRRFKHPCLFIFSVIGSDHIFVLIQDPLVYLSCGLSNQFIAETGLTQTPVAECHEKSRNIVSLTIPERTPELVQSVKYLILSNHAEAGWIKRDSFCCPRFAGRR